MDQGLKRVVARGVRPHVPYRNLNRVRNRLIDKKIRKLFNLIEQLNQTRRCLKMMSIKRLGSDQYYQYKKDLAELKQLIEDTKKSEWYIRNRERYMALQDSRYRSRRNHYSYEWMKRMY